MQQAGNSTHGSCSSYRHRHVHHMCTICSSLLGPPGMMMAPGSRLWLQTVNTELVGGGEPPGASLHTRSALPGVRLQPPLMLTVAIMPLTSTAVCTAAPGSPAGHVS